MKSCLTAAASFRAQRPDVSGCRETTACRSLTRSRPELTFTSFAGEPLYSLALGDGSSRLISLDGQVIDHFDQDKIIELIKSIIPDPARLEIRTLDQYDAYYQDRERRKPLPVIMALTNDSEATRYYIDPKTASVVGSYSNSNWVNRWLYHGLHSLSFPFLYNHRPLWDIVVITFMVGGTALCLTSLVLAWRAVGKKLRRIAGAVRQTAPEPLSLSRIRRVIAFRISNHEVR